MLKIPKYSPPSYEENTSSDIIENERKTLKKLITISLK